MTNEELREKFLDVLKTVSDDDFCSCGSKDCEREYDKYLDLIMSLIPQPEQLECEILQPDWMDGFYDIQITMPVFNLKQEALDFCKRFNLKVVNESEGK